MSRAAIVDAALEVLDRDGVEALSMRGVAEALGTGAASLYWHVCGKEELLDLVFDRVLGEIDFPSADPARWQDQTKEVLRRGREAMKRHRDLARISPERIPVGPNGLRAIEGQLAILRAGGLPDRVAAFGAALLSSYLEAFVAEEMGGLRPAGSEDLSIEDALELIRAHFSSLPADRFPNIVGLADTMMQGTPDDRFEFGLEVLLRGLATFSA